MKGLTGEVKELAGEVKELAGEMKALAGEVRELAVAQARTEERLEKLTENVQKLAESHEGLQHKVDWQEKTISDKIASLGSRWGIYNEATFRATLQAVFRKMEGITVKTGFYDDREIDVVLRNGEHILLEITSRMHSSDIKKLYRSADDYYRREGVKPTMMVATSYVSPKLMQKIMNLERPIEIFSYEGYEEEDEKL